MKHNLKRKWIIALSAAAAIFAFGGCSIQMTKEEFLSKNGLTTEVTYYANGGCFDDDFEKVKKTIWYKSNSYAYEITETSLNGKQMIEYEDYEFLGWYYAQLDSNNVPMKDEKGNMLLGEEVPFDQPIANWTTTHIVASWASLSKVKVKLVIGDEGDAIDANEKISIKTRFNDTVSQDYVLCGNGDEIRDYSFTNGIMQSTSKLTLEVKDNAYTFLNFYGDEACTQPVAWPLTKPDKDAEEKDIYIYAKYIKGNWTMLSIASDVKDMFISSATNNPSTRYYLKNDIDCSALALAPRAKFNCELKGNGYKIQNLKVSKKNLTVNESCALLGELGANAKITDITFENVEMKFQSRNKVGIYFVFSSFNEGAVIDNANFDGKIYLDFAPTAGLINDNETNWKYGGFDTDDAYTGNCTVEGEVIFE